ncbi:E3 ubiquitin-protein ligase TRIM39-like isoform X2 [Carcharodon carcharias]|uniref:E3 ubiquitin-protein ligase TRIM39-like isoform X2 n=1 Tax=Carcharodon carcharias TaxID=13397 RepID=UPI001B7DE29B|nr:E3 ubiquitin-protein ligase TRIM39-like isoform X2 [Carcharodon carcharias]
MAQYLSDDEDGAAEESLFGVELTCSVCMGLYREPVRLPCEHSFCGACIEQVFATVEAGTDYRCPVCRESYQSKPAMSKHLVLVRLVEAYIKIKKSKQRNTESEEEEDFTDAPASFLGTRGCQFRCDELVTHLCFKEWERLCPLCITSARHEGHTAKPLLEVTKDWKEEISEAKERTEDQIDRLIEFLENEKERLMIDIQHVGSEHLDAIQGLQADTTHRLQDCENTISSFQEAYKDMMDFMQRMETLVISSEDKLFHPTLNFDGIPLPSVLETWKNEDAEEDSDDDDDNDDDEDSY